MLLNHLNKRPQPNQPTALKKNKLPDREAEEVAERLQDFVHVCQPTRESNEFKEYAVGNIEVSNVAHASCTQVGVICVCVRVCVAEREREGGRAVNRGRGRRACRGPSTPTNDDTPGADRAKKNPR